MKNIFSKVMMFVMFVLGISSLVACGKRDACYVTLPDTMPTGIESITCSAGIEENGETRAGTSYGGSYDIVVQFMPGYELGELKILADGEEISEHKYFKEKTTEERSTKYSFENVRKNITITTEGSTKQLEYPVNFMIENLETSNVVFNNAKFVLKTVINGIENVSNVMTGTELRTLVGEKLEKTMHYGDTFELTMWQDSAYSYVFSDNIHSGSKLYYNIDSNGIIKTIQSIQITESTEIVLHESSFSEDSNIVSITTDYLLYTQGSLVNSSGTPFINTTLSQLNAIDETISIAVKPTKDTIEEFVWSNYSDEQLTFTINGEVVDKSKISVSDGTYCIYDVKKSYEYVDADGNMQYCPNAYIIEIIGLDNFLTSKESLLTKTTITNNLQSETLGVQCENITVFEYYLKTEKTKIKIDNFGQLPSFDVVYHIVGVGVFTISQFNTLEDGATGEGYTISKEIIGEYTAWIITIDSNVATFEVKEHIN